MTWIAQWESGFISPILIEMKVVIVMCATQSNRKSSQK